MHWINRLLAPLEAAQQKMPHGLQRGTVSNVLLTLLFFKHASAQNLMSCNALFDTCRTQDSAQCGNAIQSALQVWISRQPDKEMGQLLQAMLRPERIGYVGGLFATVNNHHGLAEIIGLIGQINLDPATPSPACGALFNQAMNLLGTGPAPAMQDAMPLLAQLLQPRANEIVFDPVCGQGGLLHACAADLAMRDSQARLFLHGLEQNENDWALANMLLYLSGVAPHRLCRGGPLHTNIALQAFQKLTPADIVLAVVPERDNPVGHATAISTLDSRFPQGVPTNIGLFTIWHCLASMKPDSGRMGVLVPSALLASSEGKTLCRYLLKNNLLDAVIELPPADQPLPLILLIRQQRTHSAIAFIGNQHDRGAITAAYGAWQHGQPQGQPHPALREIDPASVAQHDWSLEMQRYSAPIGHDTET